MMTESAKKEVLKKVSSSITFKNAPTSSALLKYLCKAEAEGKFLKEGIINIEFFGDKADNEKNSPRVRVNMYNLRKKLDAYYEHEGKEDNWRIEIKKGQYGVSYEKTPTRSIVYNSAKLKTILPYLFLFIVAVAFAISKMIQDKPPIWDKMLSNSDPTTLFVGDAFGFRGKTITGSLGWTRDYEINNLTEYYNLTEKIPELKETTSPPNYYYVTSMSVYATHELTKFFNNYSSDFKIKFETSTSFSDIKEGNTIFIGMAREKNNFLSIFNDSNPYFKSNGKKLWVSGHPSIPDTSINIWTSGINSDIAVVLKTTAANNTEQFLFFSPHDIGIVATVELFTNPDSLQAISDNYLKGKSDFVAVYEAYGHERTGMSLKNILFVPF